jgi:hypothetical protein
VLYIILALVLIGVAAWAAPRLAAGYYIFRAGQLLDQAWVDHSLIPCTQQLPDDAITQAQLQGAVTYVEQALQINPSNTSALRLLGKVYCFQGDYPKASRTFESYVNLRANDPLGHLEAGLASLNTCCDSQKNTKGACKTAKEHLKSAGVKADNLLENSISAFQNQQYQASFNYVNWNNCLGGDHTPTTDLIDDITGIITTGNIPEGDSKFANLSITVNGDTLIDEDQIVSLQIGENFGKPLGQTRSSDTKIGVIWGNGSAAAVVFVPEAGNYQVSARVLNSTPPPIIFQIEHNLFPLKTFQLDAGDKTFTTVNTSLALLPGYHLIGVNFLNDGIVDKVDRNLYLDWIKISD